MCTGAVWVRGGQSRRLLLGSTSHMNTETYRKGPKRGGFPCCTLGLVPRTTHQHSQGCSGDGFSPLLTRTRAHQTSGSSFPISYHFTTNFQSRKPRVRSPLHQQTRCPRCHRNVISRGSNTGASSMQPAKPTEPHAARQERPQQPLPTDCTDADNHD